MGDVLKPVTPLTDAQAKLVSDINQEIDALEDLAAKAQTTFAVAQATYSAAMDVFKANNDPALLAAKATYDGVIAKVKVGIANCKDRKRAIRSVELL